MEVTLKDRWDDIFGDTQHLDLELNDDEYVKIESWISDNGTRIVMAVPGLPHNYNVYSTATDEPIRDMTATEEDAVFEFAEEQFEVEEMMNHDS